MGIELLLYWGYEVVDVKFPFLFSRPPTAPPVVTSDKTLHSLLGVVRTGMENSDPGIGLLSCNLLANVLK